MLPATRIPHWSRLVEYDFSEYKWTQLAVRVVERNVTLGPGDPRRSINTDMLLGTGNYARADGQVGFEPLVLEQCQQTGMAALVQTVQLATPQESFVTVIQGVDEPFLHFAGWLTGAVEKQSPFVIFYRKSWTRGIWNHLPGNIYQSLEHSCLLYQKEVWEMEVATRPPKDQCYDGRHGDIAGGHAIAYHASMDWPVLIVDLKDWFFTILLHPDDRPKFAFTVPTINNAKPAQRYQWKVLLQGMRNCPVLCQWYAAHALYGVHKQFPGAHVYHYMDDILVAEPTQDELLRIQPQLLDALHSCGLQVAPEKIQQQPPWKYLGVKILEWTIRHQDVEFVQSVKTLNDAQKLVGVIPWLCPYLGLTTAQLSPVFELLKGDTDLKSPRELTPEARKVLEEVQQAVLAHQVYHIEPSIDVTVFITTPDLHLSRALWCAVQARVHPYYVLHVRNNTNLPGFVAEGNSRADKLANPAWVTPQLDMFTQAKASHGFFHQNAHMLQKQFQLTATEAREIVELCDDCHALGAPFLAGVNPRGLKALEFWQTDVTQVTEFGWLKYVHVTVDTFSSAVWASAHTREKPRDVIAHWRQAFAVLGTPSAVKTDNGPAYALQQILGHAGYLQNVSILTCNRRGRIRPTGEAEAVINLKATEWMNP
ncbi:hypothetical protein DUI87_30733 [Hirundo rustica rustica]|uniref:Uncharacterized protein n=1 Tax=Hirundo rustica rustica TaxID=333673 RepID=A0A3M0J210_HIRRU|nr:hypothetical protein DUI87_30733 [Hirundo rustica rustica]